MGLAPEGSRRSCAMLPKRQGHAEILSKYPATNRFQVVHFAHAKRFDEVQPTLSVEETSKLTVGEPKRSFDCQQRASNCRRRKWITVRGWDNLDIHGNPSVTDIRIVSASQ
jgi:hypothetical protein